MSVDNTIVILATKGTGKNIKEEYRVKNVQAIENLTHEPDSKNGFNNECVKDVFGDCAIFLSETDAWEEAYAIEQRVGEGVNRTRKLDFSHLTFPV